MMSSKTVSVELDPGNLLWLKSQSIVSGHRSLSEVLNEIVAKMRNDDNSASRPVQSVKGTVEISEDDPNLDGADAAVRDLFARSFGQQSGG